jgi:hypothetical protein
VDVPLEIFYGETGQQYAAGDAIKTGGMGAVRLARSSTGKPVALKTLSQELDHPDALGQEARSLQQIDHPNVVRYVDFGTEPQPFLAMELAPDGDLADLLRARQQSGDHLPIREVTAMGRQILLGLTAIHEHLVHRDLKPQNILFAADVLKVADFGLAKVLDATTASHTFKGWGTAPYQPPESWAGTSGASAAPAYDLYSVGVILYELLTLRAPFQGDRDDLRRAHLYERPTPIQRLRADVPAQLQSVVLTLLRKDPAERGGTAAEVLAALEAVSSTPDPAFGTGGPPVLQSVRDRVSNVVQQRGEAEAAELRRLEERAQREERLVVGARAFFERVDAAAEVFSANVSPLRLETRSGALGRRYSVEGLARELRIQLGSTDPEYFRAPRSPGEVVGFGYIAVAQKDVHSSNRFTVGDTIGGATVIVYVEADRSWVPRIQLLELRNHPLMRSGMREFEPFYLEATELQEHGRLLWGGAMHVFAASTVEASEENLIAWFSHLIP